MKDIIFIDSHTRGQADHGWLKAKHSFSFASYYDPSRMGIGTLRVLNDDLIAPAMGFGTHPHDNMEIITIPLQGQLKHKDSMGHESMIRAGEVQVMSAGTGITHSEYNGSPTEWLNLFQLWVLPKKQNITPRYDQKAFDFTLQSQWIHLVTSMENPGSTTALQVNQDVDFFWATIPSQSSLVYTPRFEHAKLFVMSVSGKFNCEKTTLHLRDAVGFTHTGNVTLLTDSRSQVLVIEMQDPKLA